MDAGQDPSRAFLALQAGQEPDGDLAWPWLEPLLRSAGLRPELEAWLFSLLTVLLVVATLAAARLALRRQAAGKHDTGFRQELSMFVLTLVGVVAVLLTLPVMDAMRSQLVSIFGLLLSAAVALSSTTFLGNMMAGLMLRAVRSFRTGDFLRCGEHFGRVTERGLLHTELQTEDSDLTTLPNLHLVTTPYKVVRANGTIVTATVSLGYDVPRREVERLLIAAAGDVELEQPFVHVLDLGDFSVVYRVGGLLGDVRQLLSTRSQLRARMMDRLHEAEVEIASPTLMSTRAYPPDSSFTPPVGRTPERADEEGSNGALEELAFEKADQAASVEELAARLAATEAELTAARERRKRARGADEAPAAERDVRLLELRAQRQRTLLEVRREDLARREAEGT